MIISPSPSGFSRGFRSAMNGPAPAAFSLLLLLRLTAVAAALAAMLLAPSPAIAVAGEDAALGKADEFSPNGRDCAKEICKQT